MLLSVLHERVAITTHIPGSEDLYCCFDKAGEGQNKEHEGKEEHEAGKQAALYDEDGFDDNEDDDECGDGHAVREDPESMVLSAACSLGPLRVERERGRMAENLPRRPQSHSTLY